MAVTEYKGYAIIATGDQAGTWGDTLNTNVFEVIDNNMGGIVVKSPAGSNITLTTDEAKCALIQLTGTGPSAAIQLSNSNQGFYFVENLCTGSFPITLTNGFGSSVVVPNGLRVTIFADTTNGCRIVGGLGLPSGYSQTFFNATAPPGWTKSTSVDNGTIRIVSGSGGGTGGSANFTSVFTARTILQANIPSYSLPVIDPGHAHAIGQSGGGVQGGSSFNGLRPQGQGVGFANGITNGATTGIVVNSGGSGTAMDFAVKYIDAIRAVVN